MEERINIYFYTIVWNWGNEGKMRFEDKKKKIKKIIGNKFLILGTFSIAGVIIP